MNAGNIFILQFVDVSLNGGTFMPILGILDCALMCLNNKNCFSFFFSHKTSSCANSPFRYKNTTGLTQAKGMNYYVMGIGVCKLPAVIPKGRIISVDGLTKGSKAKFICDDYHFTNITHGVCRADGTWEDLDNPCIHMPHPPYALQTKGRITPGRCVVALTTLRRTDNWPELGLYTPERETAVFYLSFRPHQRIAARNTRNGNTWGAEERSVDFWPWQYDKETNLTLCVEDTMYRCYVDDKELFTFKHRLPVAQVKLVEVRGITARSVAFTERK